MTFYYLNNNSSVTSRLRRKRHGHINFPITDGGTDKESTFHQVTRIDDPVIARFFSQEAFSLLKGYVVE
jgi:hypothetical protein